MSEETETKQVKTFAVSNPGAAGFDQFELTDEGKEALMSTEPIKKEHLIWNKITNDGEGKEKKDDDKQIDPKDYEYHVNKINTKLDKDGREAIIAKIHSIFLGGRKRRKSRRKTRRGGKRKIYRVKAVKAWLKRTKRRRKKRKTKKKKKRKRRRTRR